MVVVFDAGDVARAFDELDQQRASVMTCWFQWDPSSDVDNVRRLANRIDGEDRVERV